MTWTAVASVTTGLPMNGTDVVAEDAETKSVVFVTPLTVGTTYALVVSPTWNTTVSVVTKLTTGFTVAFGTPAPASASIDWQLEEL